MGSGEETRRRSGQQRNRLELIDRLGSHLDFTGVSLSEDCSVSRLMN
jgi:hypothetical protein